MVLIEVITYYQITTSAVGGFFYSEIFVLAHRLVSHEVSDNEAYDATFQGKIGQREFQH